MTAEVSDDASIATVREISATMTVMIADGAGNVLQ
jgi:hypothetical protein